MVTIGYPPLTSPPFLQIIWNLRRIQFGCLLISPHSSFLSFVRVFVLGDWCATNFSFLGNQIFNFNVVPMEMRRRFILFNMDKGRNGGREDKFPSTPFMASIENVMHWMVTLYSHKNAQTHNDNRWISKQLFSQNYTIFNEKWIWIRMMLLIRFVCAVYFHLPRLFGSFKKKKKENIRCFDG